MIFFYFAIRWCIGSTILSQSISTPKYQEVYYFGLNNSRYFPPKISFSIRSYITEISSVLIQLISHEIVQMSLNKKIKVHSES